MSQYYYFVASLPTLRYEERDSMEPAEFLELAAEHVHKDEFEELRSATTDAPDLLRVSSEAVRSWLEFERGLRNALVRIRAQRAGSEAAQFRRLDVDGNAGSDSPSIEELAREASSHDSPLSGEEMINRARFAFASEIAVGHYFDLDVLVSYYVQLQVLARRRVFTRKAGEAAFSRINDRIVNEYYGNEENRA